MYCLSQKKFATPTLTFKKKFATPTLTDTNLATPTLTPTSRPQTSKNRKYVADNLGNYQR